MRKIKAGKRLPAAELAFLDPNVEDSASSLNKVSNVSDLKPGSRVSPVSSAVPEVRHLILLENLVPSESTSRSHQTDDGSAEASTSRSRQTDDGSAEDSASPSQLQDGEEEVSIYDDFDEEYWANEIALWDVLSADARAGQDSEDKGDDGDEEDSN